eukprot:GILJ01010040.1.p1 GENE.GILJ01010040.1~~GILJ01010040.1.p1  ORF type:complete len:336 (+),score=71.61 GILJ01010040.1:134-1009(+)
MVAFDISPMDATAYKKNAQFLLDYTRDNVQLLINQLFALPTASSEEGIFAQLPKGSTVIPREKPLPKAKPMTRWEKFAQEKGIVKQKRSRMVFDESAQDYKPRFGFKSIKKAQDDANWMVEAKPGDDLTEDPFEKISSKKKLVKAKQKMREMRNELESKGKKLPAGLVNLAAPLPSQKRGKSGLEKALKAAQKSTASIGKFDQKAFREKEIKEKGIRRKYDSVVSSDRDRNMKMLNKVVAGDTKYDTAKAAKIQIREDQDGAHQANKDAYKAKKLSAPKRVWSGSKRQKRK